MQRSLDDSGQVRESGSEVAHQQDDCREAGRAEGGPEEEATDPSSERAQLQLLSGLELRYLLRDQLQETTSLLRGDQARLGLSGETSGSPTQSASAERLKEIKKSDPVLPPRCINCKYFSSLGFNIITSLYS